MIPCEGCGAHVRPSGACPVCDAPAPRVPVLSGVALLLGLAACPGEKDSTVQPEYGISITAETTDTAPE